MTFQIAAAIAVTILSLALIVWAIRREICSRKMHKHAMKVMDRDRS